MGKNSLAASWRSRREAVLARSLRDFTSVFGMGTGVAPSPWPPVCKQSGLKLIKGTAVGSENYFY